MSLLERNEAQQREIVDHMLEHIDEMASDEWQACKRALIELIDEQLRFESRYRRDLELAERKADVREQMEALNQDIHERYQALCEEFEQRKGKILGPLRGWWEAEERRRGEREQKQLHDLYGQTHERLTRLSDVQDVRS